MEYYSTTKKKHSTALFVIIVFTIVLAWGLLHFHFERQAHKKHLAENELQLINQLQRKNIQFWRERRLVDASHLTEDNLLNSTISHWFNDRSIISSKNSLQSHISNALRIMQEQRGYNAAYLIDLNGNIVLDALGKTHKPLPDEELTAMHKAFEIASPIAIEPHTHDFFGFPFFGVITPIYDQHNKPIASIWLVTDVRKTLYTLIETWPGSSGTAESNLIMQTDDNILLISPLRNDPELSLPHQAQPHEGNNVFAKAINGMHGLFDAVDYRNKSVIATATLINQSPWVLVTKIDQDEVLKNSAQELLALAAPIVFYLLVVSTSLIYVQRQNWQHEKKLTLELERMVRRDALTNIDNRLSLDENLNKEWDKAYRSHKPLSLLMIDIDFFKKFNDTYGHLEGDECLKFVAKTLTSSAVRSSDLVARYGGEEFAILLPETEANDALELGKRICAHISKQQYKHMYSDNISMITVSMGLATIYPNTEETTVNVNHLIQRADHALYSAKQSGRNQVKEFSSF